MSAPVPVSPDSAAITSGGQFLALILRFVVGYAVMFVCLLLLLRRSPWTFSAVDAVYWLALVLAVLLHRVTSRGADQIARWRTSAVQHLIVGGVLWLLCQAVHVIP